MDPFKRCAGLWLRIPIHELTWNSARCKACTSISTNIRRASERLAVHTKQSRAFVRACVHVYDASSSIRALADRDKIESGKVRDIALCTITWNLNVKTTWAGNYYTYTTRSCWVGITAKKVNKHYRSVVTCDCALPCRPHKKKRVQIVYGITLAGAQVSINWQTYTR